eukprot:gene8692-1081_t
MYMRNTLHRPAGNRGLDELSGEDGGDEKNHHQPDAKRWRGFFNEVSLGGRSGVYVASQLEALYCYQCAFVSKQLSTVISDAFVRTTADAQDGSIQSAARAGCPSVRLVAIVARCALHRDCYCCIKTATAANAAAANAAATAANAASCSRSTSVCDVLCLRL